jgi:hypothetical protein
MRSLRISADGLVKNFETRDGSGKLQPSQVVGLIKTFEPTEGHPIVQIDTSGSADRANPGKQSQTIQLGRVAARELFDILKRTYDFR